MLPTDAEQLAQVSAGLASLDVQLPERGQLYRFTTPRGDIAITARAVPLDVLSRLTALAAVWSPSCSSGSSVASRPAALPRDSEIPPAFGIALAILGFVGFIGGILPLAGVLLIALGSSSPFAGIRSSTAVGGDLNGDACLVA